MRTRHLGIIVASLVPACSEPPPSISTPFPPAPIERLTFPAAPRRELDLLFVIDNAGSVWEAQAAVASSLGGLLATLERGLGTRADLHIGVVSTDMGTLGVTFGACSPPGRPAGDDGALLRNGCAGIDGTFLRDVARPDGTRDVNYVGELTERFGCMARLGTAGCAVEAPLGALDRALAPGRNPGFVRAGSTLAVVLVTNEDDCTFTDPAFLDPANTALGPLGRFRCFEAGVRCEPDQPRRFGTHVGCHAREDSPYLPSVAGFVERLRARRPEPGRLVAAAIHGSVDAARTAEVVPDDPDAARPALAPSCSGQTGWGLPAFRLADFIDALGGTTGTVCDADQTATMTALGARIGATLGVPCFANAVRDADPAVPGVQAQCTVGEATVATGDFHLVPACDEGLGGACWRVVEDAARCPLGAHHYLAVDRPTPAPAGATLTATCTIE